MSVVPAGARPLLSVRNLTVAFGRSTVVEDLSFDLAPGEILGVVGESGSGKSITALSVLRLVPAPGRVTGAITFGDVDLMALPEPEMREIRGRDIAMIFQEPMTSLNPVFTCGDQVMEALVYHRGLDRAGARAEALKLLKLVEIPSAERRLDDYPHQLSGGMRQRVMIAMALACRPRVLLADEPTTALDATIQAQILDLLRGLQRELGMAVILITHDLGVVAEVAHRVMVMYAGRAVETSPAAEIFARPFHPYTEGLLASIPRLDGPIERLDAIPGQVPPPEAMPQGCRFAPRCRYAEDACRIAVPPLAPRGPSRTAACIRGAA
ncbi:MAG: ABC transporter ATP-binding protein [Alphaproteobacteria bacterium]|nr:ABC transporter ATP-binding protein [Alphaproteobacteria bacterium]